MGLLLAMIPEFEPLTGRVQHDVYHIYTVDVHSIAAIDRLRALMRGDAAGELGLCSRMAAETVRHLPLFLGLLLHDIGKAHGRDHARQGAIMARPIAERLGLSPIDVDHVVWLVQEHLSLYHWATRRDTSDPTTIREVATQVGAPDRLRDLYLLTFADLSTTNPKAMTDWKARMLDELYFGVASHLEGKSPDMRRRARDLRDEARVGFVGDAGQQELEAFVDGMPERYLLAHPVDVIRRHARAARGRTDKRVHVALSPGSSEDVTELLVLMDDRAGLLSEVSIALTVNRLEITAAQVYARERPKGPPEAVDLLQVRRSGRHVDHIEQSELDQLARDIEDLVENRVSVEEIKKRVPSLPKWAAPRGPSVPTRVVIDNEASSRYTVVDVYAHDHPGLLHDIARVLSEENLTIGMAKVNTEGLKAADVFYVEREGGGKLSDPMQAEALRARLHASIDAASVN